MILPAALWVPLKNLGSGPFETVPGGQRCVKNPGYKYNGLLGFVGSPIRLAVVPLGLASSVGFDQNQFTGFLIWDGDIRTTASLKRAWATRLNKTVMGVFQGHRWSDGQGVTREVRKGDSGEPFAWAAAKV